ncbi:extracellular solute-binding protein [Sphaerisporangium krabiense]|uniref:Putative spermidine/putrescine transport system substrate-binding protein n=1 Tax=Sphaerisporangium krabiense TaxID=763782 RepID=A0A7W8Z6W3_9ACTN|nr:extracellular solute-binding protein [Sphaerisporangium krabiense]MBB5628574.1 putative spermidine/putrescine transport system substrate-binding protein [Sphaerisporangium krabiense]
MRRRRSAGAASLAAAAALLAACGAGTGAHEQRAQVVAARATPRPPSATPPVTPSASVSGTASPSPSRTAPGRGEGTVTVVAYRGYAEYGGSDSAVNWVGEFERNTGCRVNLRYAQNADELDKLVSGGDYDAVAAPPQVAGRLIAEKKAAALTTSLIPRYQQIPEWLRTQPAITAEGRVYGVPYLWGYYRTFYDDSRSPRPKADALYSGAVPAVLRDGPLSIADAALRLKESKPSLGVKNPFKLTRQQFDAALALLGAHAAGGRSYWTNPVEAVQALSGGEARVVRALPYTGYVARAAGRPVKALDERGPTTGWVDSWMISAQAAAPNCAYRWIDWAVSAKPEQQAAVWNGLAPANPRGCTWDPGDDAAKAARAALAARVCDAYQVDGERPRDVAFAVRPSKDCGGRDGECTDYAEWAAAWQRLVRPTG